MSITDEERLAALEVRMTELETKMAEQVAPALTNAASALLALAELVKDLLEKMALHGVDRDQLPMS